MEPRRKRTWPAVLRVLFGLGLLAFVVSRVDLPRVVELLSEVDPAFLALAALAQLVITIGRTIRWRQILRANGMDRSFSDLLALMFIGLFFNTCLPTSMGGDLIRGYYTSRGGKNLVASYSALLVERALGLISLAAVAASATLAVLAAGTSPLPRGVLISVAAVATALMVVGGLVFACPGWRSLVGRLSWLGARVLRVAEGLSGALEMFRRPETPRLAIVCASLVLQIVAVVFHMACARAVGLHLPALAFFLVVPASILAAMLPVSLNGLGVREGVLVGLVVAYGAPAARAGAFALVALLVASALALTGGLVYLLYRAPDPDEGKVRG